MRLLALTVLALVFAAVPVSAQAIGSGRTYASDPNSTPGEPPTAVLVMTGMVGIAFVGSKNLFKN